jgi:glucose-1-phosphate thymidylyltransferase
MPDPRVGIIVAGGLGTRLFPATRPLNKHLLPIYDKPMVYYPLSLLMLAGIRDVIVISTPDQLPNFRTLFGGGGHLGMHFDFVEQDEPRGVADVFLVAEKTISERPCAVVLGDNLLYGVGLTTMLRKAVDDRGATIFAYPVRDPGRFGIVELDKEDRPVALVEKPENSASNLAVPGLYFFDSQATTLVKSLKPSARGELEITDLNRLYLENGDLNVIQLGRGTAWLDAGTWEDLVDATNFVASIESRQRLKIGCIEEIAWRNGWLDDAALAALIETMPKGPYRDYLQSFVEG